MHFWAVASLSHLTEWLILRTAISMTTRCPVIALTIVLRSPSKTIALEAQKCAIAVVRPNIVGLSVLAVGIVRRGALTIVLHSPSKAIVVEAHKCALILAEGSTFLARQH